MELMHKAVPAEWDLSAFDGHGYMYGCRHCNRQPRVVIVPVADQSIVYPSCSHEACIKEVQRQVIERVMELQHQVASQLSLFEKFNLIVERQQKRYVDGVPADIDGRISFFVAEDNERRQFD
jgi:hypothetical protein